MSETKRVLVTGGAGFIGSHIAGALLARGDSVAIIDDLSTGKRENVPTGAELHEVDVRDEAAVQRVFSEFKPQVVCHQAAMASVSRSVREPATDASINIIGGLNVLEAARAHGVDRFVFASTGGALYGEVPEGETADESWAAQPKSPYAVAKAAFEMYLKSYGKNFDLAWTALRYANVYGPRQDPYGEAGVVAIFSDRLLAGKGVLLFALKTPGDPGCIRDYVFVGDVVAANLLAIDGVVDGLANVGTGKPRTTKDILDRLAEAAGTTALVEDAPPRPGDLERSVLNADRLRSFGWAPSVSFKDGLALTLDWFKNR